jgi:hypothetical protein
MDLIKKKAISGDYREVLRPQQCIAFGSGSCAKGGA